MRRIKLKKINTIELKKDDRLIFTVDEKLTGEEEHHARDCIERIFPNIPFLILSKGWEITKISKKERKDDF